MRLLPAALLVLSISAAAVDVGTYVAGPRVQVAVEGRAPLTLLLPVAWTSQAKDGLLTLLPPGRIPRVLCWPTKAADVPAASKDAAALCAGRLAAFAPGKPGQVPKAVVPAQRVSGSAEEDGNPILAEVVFFAQGGTVFALLASGDEEAVTAMRGTIDGIVGRVKP